MRAVIDTNIWVSAIFTPGMHSHAVVEALARGDFEACYCEKTLTELKDTVTSPLNTFKYGWRIEPLNTVIRLVTTGGRELPDPPIFPISRDPNDDIFIALAIASDADFLVTRDDDLKGDPAVREYLEAAGVRLVTVREFVEALGAAE